MKLLMDSKASSVIWAVVLAVCAVGSLSTCGAHAAPLILQLDSMSLLGHRLVIAIEPLHDGVTTPATEVSNTTTILVNTTADATNGSIISFDSNSDVATVTLDGHEIVSAAADYTTTTEAGLPPATSTAAAAMAGGVLVAADPRSGKSEHLTGIDYKTTTTPIPGNIVEKEIIPKIRPRIRDMEYVDKFLINFPDRCPPGWKLEHGQCRRPFNHVNDLVRPRSKSKLKRKIKMMA